MAQPGTDNLKKGDVISDKSQTLHFSHYETDEHGVRTGKLVCYNDESESVIIHKEDIIHTENQEQNNSQEAPDIEDITDVEE
jgi:hypothetical protein